MNPVSPTRQKISVVTWSPVCRRSESLADKLGVPLHTVHYLWYRKPWIAPIKYVAQTIKTLAILARERPAIVVVANPPLFAVLAVYLHCRLFGGRYVVDSHTGVFVEAKWTWLRPLNRFLSTRAALTIVTNEHLQSIVAAWGANVAVIEVTLPRLRRPPTDYPVPRGAFNVVGIFSFEKDEPVEETLALRDLPANVKLHITGDDALVPRRLRDNMSDQVVLTGFLSEADYASLLHQCDAVLVLCTRPHTMLCGAYEAAALAKPIVTSDWPEMRACFHKGTVFVENSAAGIRNGLQEVYERREQLRGEMADLRSELDQQWAAKLAGCLAEIAADASGAPAMVRPVSGQLRGRS